MKTYLIKLVCEDSSVFTQLVKGSSKENALNALLNKTLFKQPVKFVIFDEVEIISDDSDVQLVKDFKEIKLGEDSVYTFENTLNELIFIDGFSVQLGDVLNFKEFLK